AMKRHGGMLLIFLLLTVSMPRHVQGQAAVIDAANLVQNTLAAIKTTVMVVNQLLELEGLGSIVLDAGFAEDLTTLGEIARAAQALGNDLQSLNAQITTLFGLSTAPRSTGALAQRMSQLRQMSWDAYVMALRAQTLMNTVQRTILHMKQLLTGIQKLL